MSYSHSLVVICPEAVRDSLLALGNAVGVVGGMDVRLSANGSEPVTHYGSHSWASSDFVLMMTKETYPDPLPDGVTIEQIDLILDQCIVSVDPVVDDITLSKREHFDFVIGNAGLSIITDNI